jgi:hypothetical protein
MAGKHRGPSHKGKLSRLSRVTLDPRVVEYIEAMCDREQRSYGNALSVLVTEAVEQRLAVLVVRGEIR